MVEDKVKQEIEPFHDEQEESDLQGGEEFSQGEEFKRIKRKTTINCRYAMGSRRRISDLDVDLFT